MISILHKLQYSQRIAKIGTWEVNFQTELAEWSEETCRIFDVPFENATFTATDWYSFIHPDDLNLVTGLIQQSEQTHQGFDFYHRIITKKGVTKYIYSWVEYEFNEQHIPVGMFGVIHDVTGTAELQSQLATSEDNIKRIINTIPVSVYARDENGYYLFGNHIFLSHYGITEQQLRGKHISDLVKNKKELDNLLFQDKVALSSGQKIHCSKFTQKNSEGVETNWQIIKVPFTLPHRNIRAILGVAEDVTKMVRQEEELRTLNSKLMERNKELEEFSHMISHDMRGPLATLMGVINVIGDYDLTQQEIAEFLGGIKGSLYKLDEITKTMNTILNRY